MLRSHSPDAGELEVLLGPPPTSNQWAAPTRNRTMSGIQGRVILGYCPYSQVAQASHIYI